jgi:hypothetical protein
MATYYEVKIPVDDTTVIFMVCWTCGAFVFNMDAHSQFHEGVINAKPSRN